MLGRVSQTSRTLYLIFDESRFVTVLRLSYVSVSVVIEYLLIMNESTYKCRRDRLREPDTRSAVSHNIFDSKS